MQYDLIILPLSIIMFVFALFTIESRKTKPLTTKGLCIYALIGGPIGIIILVSVIMANYLHKSATYLANKLNEKIK